MQRIGTKVLAATLTAALAVMPCELPAFAAQAESNTITSAVTVSPDENGDFDAYDATVVFTIEDGLLTNISFSSEWGIKPAQNQRFSTNALSGIGGTLASKANHIRKIDEQAVTVDTVSGATCSSAAIQTALKDAAAQADGYSWSGISSALTCSINGETITLNSSKPEEEEEEEGGSGEQGGGKPSRDLGITLEDGYGVSYQFLSENAGDLQYQMIYKLPDGYSCTGINLVRVGNSAYMQMKDPEAFASMFEFDAETGILTVHTDNSVHPIETGSTLTVSLKLEHDGQSGNVDVTIPVSKITLKDRISGYKARFVQSVKQLLPKA